MVTRPADARRPARSPSLARPPTRPPPWRSFFFPARIGFVVHLHHPRNEHADGSCIPLFSCHPIPFLARHRAGVDYRISKTLKLGPSGRVPGWVVF